MNCDTGHIVRGLGEDFPPHGYTRLPADMEPAATKFLGDRTEGRVSLTSGGKLSKWAAKERNRRKKQAKASQRRNRN